MIYKVVSYSINAPENTEVRYVSELKGHQEMTTNAKDEKNSLVKTKDKYTLTINNEIIYEYIPLFKGRNFHNMVSYIEMTLQYMALQYKITEPYYHQNGNNPDNYYLGIEINTIGYSSDGTKRVYNHLFTGDIGIEDMEYIISDPTLVCYRGAYFEPLLTRCLYEAMDLCRHYTNIQYQNAMENNCGCLNKQIIKTIGEEIKNEK